jgi:hypothetical protein
LALAAFIDQYYGIQVVFEALVGSCLAVCK